MPEELTLVVNSEQVDVLAPPTEIRLTVGVGSPGTRGSKIWAGSPDPISFFTALGEQPFVGDMYISITTQKAHQLVATPAGPTWNLLFDLASLTEYILTPNSELTWTGAVTMSGLISGPALLPATLTGNTTLNFTSPQTTKAFTVTVILTQGTGGSKTLTATGVKWATGVPPVLSTAAGAIDILNFMWTGTTWIGLVGGMAFA